MDITLRDVSEALQEAALKAISYFHNRLEKGGYRAVGSYLNLEKGGYRALLSLIKTRKREFKEKWMRESRRPEGEAVEAVNEECVNIIASVLNIEVEKEKGEESWPWSKGFDVSPGPLNWHEEVKRKKAQCPSLEEVVIKHEGYKVSVEDVAKATGISLQSLSALRPVDGIFSLEDADLLRKWIGHEKAGAWYREGEKEEIIVRAPGLVWEVKRPRRK